MAIRPKHAVPGSALFVIENWVGVQIDAAHGEDFYPTLKEASAYAERMGRQISANYRKARVARRGRSIYLLTPIRKGPK